MLSFVSGLALLVVGLSMLFNKRLNRFPYTLVAWTTLYESLLFFNYTSQILIFYDEIHRFVYHNIYVIYSPIYKYVFGIEHDGSQSDRFFLVYCQMFTREMAMYMIIVSYSCILVEILRVLKNPFKPQMQFWVQY